MKSFVLERISDGIVHYPSRMALYGEYLLQYAGAAACLLALIGIAGRSAPLLCGLAALLVLPLFGLKVQARFIVPYVPFLILLAVIAVGEPAPADGTAAPSTKERKDAGSLSRSCFASSGDRVTPSRGMRAWISRAMARPIAAARSLTRPDSSIFTMIASPGTRRMSPAVSSVTPMRTGMTRRTRRIT